MKKERIAKDPDPACTSTERAPGSFLPTPRTWGRWVEKSIIFIPRILKQTNSSHTALLFLPVSDLILPKVWSGCQSTRAASAQWRLPQQLKVTCVRTCPSFTLALKQNHLAVPAVHCASFHKSRPKCPSHTFKAKSPQDFYSKKDDLFPLRVASLQLFNSTQ